MSLKTNKIQSFSGEKIEITDAILLPRKTTSERNLLTPMEGLSIFNTDNQSIEYYDIDDSSWKSASGIQTINGQTAKNQILSVGTSGTSPNISQSSSNTNNINIPLAVTDSVTAGLISNAEYDYFTAKADGNDARFSTAKLLKVKKNPGTGEFSTIDDALQSIVDSDSTNPYIVEVGPGIYEEPELTVPTYVSVKGSSINTTIVKPLLAAQNLFIMSELSELSFLTLQGHVSSIGSGYPAILVDDSGDFSQFHKLSIYDFDIGLKIRSVTTDTVAYLEYVDINGDYEYAIHQSSNNGFYCKCQLENFYTYPSFSSTKTTILSEGEDSKLLVHVSGIIGSSGGKGIVLRDGSHCDISAAFFDELENAITIENTGSGSQLHMSGTTFGECTKNIKILHPSASGYFEGYSEASKLEINSDSSFFITGKDSKIITVSKLGGDYTSINDAMNSITDNSVTNAYIISVGPGLFVEDTINGKSYVSIIGSGLGSTVIEVDDVDKNIIEGNVAFTIKNISLQGATGVGKAAIYYEPTANGEGLIIDNVEFRSNYTFVNLYSDAFGGIVDAHNIVSTLTTEFTKAFICESVSGNQAIMSVENFQGIVTSPTPVVYEGHGDGSFLVITNNGVQSLTGGKFLTAYDGTRVTCRVLAVEGFDTSIETQNIGDGPNLQITASIFISNTNDLLISNPDTFGSFQGQADNAKITINPASLLRMNYVDASDPTIGTIALGELLQGDRHDRLLSISKLARQTSPVGAYSGGIVSVVTGLQISVTSGAGFVVDSVDNFMKELTWSTGTLNLPADEGNYIYINNSGTLTYVNSEPAILENIILGRVSTFASDVHFIDKSSVRSNQLGTRIEEYQRKYIGAIYASGSLVTENGTRGLNVSSGQFAFGNTEFSPTGGTAITWGAHYRDGSGGFTHGAQSTVSNSQYDDDSGTLQSLTTSYYAKHSLYVSGDSTEEKYHLVYSQAQYSSLVLAESADIPISPISFKDGVVLIATIIVQQGTASIIQIRDERPILGFKASGVSATSTHGNLFGLGADDHLQYFRTDGGRQATGSFDMGGNSITNINLVDGVDVSNHAARHLPSGADPLTTAAPTTSLSATTTNSVGIQNSLSKSDHGHAILTGTPSTQIPDQSNAAGSSANLAKADHIHNIPTAAPVGTIGANSTNDIGIAGSFSKSDHDHQIATGTPSTLTPDQSNSGGSSNNLAKADHIHNIPTAVATSISTSTSNTQGVAGNFSKADHTHAVSVTNGEVSSATNATTLSAVDTLLTGITVTPPVGTYLIIFSAEGVNSGNGSQRNFYSIYVGGTQNTNSERSLGVASGAWGNIATNAIVTVNGSQAIEIRWRVIAGTGTTGNRTMSWAKLA